MPRPEPSDFQAALAVFLDAIAPETPVADGIWLRFWMHRLDPALQSGWKLHLSSTPFQYGAFLNCVLPVLLVHGHPFKIARDLEVIENLNDGRYGLGQVGKVLTVYPPDEAAAAQLADALANATYNLAGAPVIPGDYRFDPRAPVYFRFGPFDARFTLDAMGRKRRLVAVPGQGDFPDTADGGEAPLPAAVHLPSPPLYDHLAYLRDAYLFVQMLHLSAKGAVLIALPKAAGTRKPLLVKTARKGTCSDAHGRDAVDALHREHALLSRFEGQAGFPAPGELRCDGDDVAAVIRPWIPGETFWAHWTKPEARLPEGRKALAAVLRALLPIVRKAHAMGVALRDLAPGNLLLGPDGPIVLDVELAEALDTPEPYRRGTLGFYDPALARETPVDIAADHYALLGLAWMIARDEVPGWTVGGLHDGATPGTPMYREDAFGRAFAVAWAARGADGAFAHAYETLLDTVDAPQGALPTPDMAPLWEKLLHEVAASLDALLASPPEPDRANVYSGASGLLLAGLAHAPERTLALVDAKGWERVTAQLFAGAALVVHIPGYYFGASGIAALLGRLGSAGGRAETTRCALDLLAQIDLGNADVPDLCQGVAGYLQAALELLAATGDERARAAAGRAVDHLLALSVPGPGEGLQWPWPEGDFGSLAGQACYGYGHGVAGIVDVLFQAAVQLQRPDAQEAAEAGLRTLHATAISMDGDGCWWPVAADDDTCWNGWCHGTPGILRALARALTIRPSGADTTLALRGLRGMAAANAGHWCRCHGVASRLDAYNAILPILPEGMDTPFQATAAMDAAMLARMLPAGLCDTESVPSHDATASGVMTGQAGVIAALLRRNSQ